MTVEPDSLRRKISEECLSDLQIDRLVADEEPSLADPQLAHLKDCPICSQRLEARRQEQADFSQQFDLSGLATATLQRTETVEAPRSPAWLRWWLAPLAAVASGLLIIALLLPGGPGPDDRSGIRTKGRASFSVLVNRGGPNLDARSKDVFYPGDRLRFLVSSPLPVHTAVFDIEARGTVVVFAPTEGRESLRVEAGKRVPLPGAIELDAASGAEVLVGVFCPEAFDTSTAALALKPWDRSEARLKQLVKQIGAGCHAQTFAMDKKDQRP